MQIITTTTTQLESVQQVKGSKINTLVTQEGKYDELPYLNAIERGGEGRLLSLGNSFRVIAWNGKRCLATPNTIKLLSGLDPEIILLSEMNNSVAGAEQQHTIKCLANHLNMYYLYGVEFLELSSDYRSDVNACQAHPVEPSALHGNAILSKMPIEKAAMVRFEHCEQCGTFGDDCCEQRRLGGHMGLLALIKTDNQQQVCFASTHFDSLSGVDGRDKQMFDLLATIEAFAGSDTPVIIGGDLNTGNNLFKGQDYTNETLFSTAKSYGYHWRGNDQGATTRSSTTPNDRVSMKFDWFCARHIESHFQAIVPAIDSENRLLSNHEIILSDWSLDNESPVEKQPNKSSSR